MRTADYTAIRKKCSGYPANREKVEHILAELYEAKKWRPFKHIVYASSPIGYHPTTPRYYPRHSRVVSHLSRSRSLDLERLPSSSNADPFAMLYIRSNTEACLRQNRPKIGTVSLILQELIKEILDFSPSRFVPKVLEKPLEAHFNEDNRFHRADGPAVVWGSGSKQWYWNGVWASQRFIEDPPTFQYIQRQQNQERKRVLIERFGEENYLKALNAKLVAEDEHGKLWRYKINSFYITDNEGQFVEVTNSSPEPDGSYRTFFLKVPPSVKTPKEAVAWTFGEKAGTYKPLVET